MSDGPYKSLPMSGRWKRLAEVGDTEACAAAEVTAALVAALDDDCRRDLTSEFIQAFSGVFTSLFQGEIETQLESLRAVAGSGLGQSVVDYAVQLAATGGSSEDVPLSALTMALSERSARGVRQVEEHYLRKSNQRRARNLRLRLEDGVGSAQSDIERLARSTLRLEPRTIASVQRQNGLDDGVTLL